MCPCSREPECSWDGEGAAPPPLGQAGAGGGGRQKEPDKLEPLWGGSHGDFHRPRLFRVGKLFLLLCGGESWGGRGVWGGWGAPSPLLGAMITPLAATTAPSMTAATMDTGSGVTSTLGEGGGGTGLGGRGGGGGGGRGGGSGSTGVPGRRGSRALRASLSLASPCRRVPASSRMALAVSCWARRKSREGSGAEGGAGSAGGGGLGGEGATGTCCGGWSGGGRGGGGGGAGGGGDKARRGSWTVCRAGGGEDSRSLGGWQPPSWGLQGDLAQGSGLLEPPLLWAGVSVERERSKMWVTP